MGLAASRRYEDAPPAAGAEDPVLVVHDVARPSAAGGASSSCASRGDLRRPERARARNAREGRAFDLLGRPAPTRLLQVRRGRPPGRRRARDAREPRTPRARRRRRGGGARRRRRRDRRRGRARGGRARGRAPQPRGGRRGTAESTAPRGARARRSRPSRRASLSPVWPVRGSRSFERRGPPRLPRSWARARVSRAPPGRRSPPVPPANINLARAGVSRSARALVGGAIASTTPSARRAARRVRAAVRARRGRPAGRVRAARRTRPRGARRPRRARRLGRAGVGSSLSRAGERDGPARARAADGGAPRGARSLRPPPPPPRARVAARVAGDAGPPPARPPPPVSRRSRVFKKLVVLNRLATELAVADGAAAAAAGRLWRRVRAVHAVDPGNSAGDDPAATATAAARAATR